MPRTVLSFGEMLWDLLPTATTLGCGDAFSAGLIHRYLRGAPLGECCHSGNAMGAIVASQQGGTVPVSQNDLSQFLASDRRRIADPAVERFAIE